MNDLFQHGYRSRLWLSHYKTSMWLLQLNQSVFELQDRDWWSDFLLQAFLVESKSNGPSPEAAIDHYTTPHYPHGVRLLLFSVWNAVLLLWQTNRTQLLSKPQNIFPKRLGNHQDVFVGVFPKLGLGLKLLSLDMFKYKVMKYYSLINSFVTLSRLTDHEYFAPQPFFRFFSSW